jgi:hypothetical protein
LPVSRSAKEIEAIEEEHQRKLQQIKNKGQIDQLNISNEFYKKQITKIQEGESTSKTKDIEDYTNDLIKLDAKLQSGTLSLKAFEKAKKELDDKADIKALEDQAMALDKMRNAALNRSGGPDYDSANKFGMQIAEVNKQIELKKVDQSKISEKDTEAIKQKGVEIAEKSSQMIMSYENRVLENAIKSNDKQLSLIESRKTANEKMIESSTLSEAKKAEEISKINIKAQTEKEQLEAKNKAIEEKKAKYEKLESIFNITLNTLAAVMKAGGLTPMGIADAALGAAALATAIATPLPKFAEGGNITHPTLALTDEKGQEGYITKNGFYLGSNKPNVKYLQPGTTIIPHEVLNQYMLNAMMNSNSTSLPEGSNSTDRKLDQLMIANYHQNNELIKAIKKNKTIVKNNINISSSDWIRANITQ